MHHILLCARVYSPSVHIPPTRAYAPNSHTRPSPVPLLASHASMRPHARAPLSAPRARPKIVFHSFSLLFIPLRTFSSFCAPLRTYLRLFAPFRAVSRLFAPFRASSRRFTPLCDGVMPHALAAAPVNARHHAARAAAVVAEQPARLLLS
eukprot:4016134-Pleurochrysis_carterae.AAC.2